MATWITDENGNRCSVERFGSREAAQSALNSLINCTDCTDCTNCTDCKDCTRCTDCKDCTLCTDCTHCTQCTDCAGCIGCIDCTDCTDCTYCAHCKRCYIIKQISGPPLVVGPSRSDGYQFVLTSDGGVRAGCRVFDTIDDARKHWTTTRGGTALGDETMQILDFYEARLNNNTPPTGD